MNEDRLVKGGMEGITGSWVCKKAILAGNRRQGREWKDGGISHAKKRMSSEQIKVQEKRETQLPRHAAR